MSHLHPDDDIYPVRIYVDKRLWPQPWRITARNPTAAMNAAMEHAKKTLVPGTEVLLRAEGQVMHRFLPADPSYVPAD